MIKENLWHPVDRGILHLKVPVMGEMTIHSIIELEADQCYAWTIFSIKKQKDRNRLNKVPSCFVYAH